MDSKQKAALSAIEEYLIRWYDCIVSSETIRFSGSPHYGRIDPSEPDVESELQAIEGFAKAFNITLPTRAECSGIEPPESTGDNEP